MADWTTKAHDTWPPMPGALTDLNGPIDLTAATVVRLKLKSATLAVTTGPVDITDPANGKVSYTWQPGDTATAGDYQAEWEIQWAAGGTETVPNDTYFAVSIVEDLG